MGKIELPHNKVQKQPHIKSEAAVVQNLRASQNKYVCFAPGFRNKIIRVNQLTTWK